MQPFIETDCTIKHEGKAYTANGAFISDTRLIAYPGEKGVLKDWHGNTIGQWWEVSSRPAVFFGHRSFYGSRLYFMRARVNGKLYSLRGFGEGMVAKGRVIKG